MKISAMTPLGKCEQEVFFSYKQIGHQQHSLRRLTPLTICVFNDP